MTVYQCDWLKFRIKVAKTFAVFLTNTGAPPKPIWITFDTLAKTFTILEKGTLTHNACFDNIEDARKKWIITSNFVYDLNNLRKVLMNFAIIIRFFLLKQVLHTRTPVRVIPLHKFSPFLFQENVRTSICIRVIMSMKDIAHLHLISFVRKCNTDQKTP